MFTPIITLQLKRLWLCLLFICFAIPMAVAQTQGSEAAKQELRGIDDQIQTLKQEVIQINNELSLLEEKLLFPSSSQLAVFISIPEKIDFSPDAIKLSINGQEIANHLYKFREIEALLKGGVQRLITTNISSGMHKVQVKLLSRKGSGKAFESTGDFNLEKGTDPKFIELQLIDTGAEAQITLRDW